MPNWCEHHITISGAAAEIKAIQTVFDGGVDESSGTVSLLALFIPRPPELDGTIAPRRLPYSDDALAAADDETRQVMAEENAAYLEREAELLQQFGAVNWYDWSIANWGTKWPDRSCVVRRGPRSIVLHGSCPWAPPIEGIVRISQQFPNLRFKIEWFEGGMQFAGKAAYVNGDALYHEDRTYRGRRGG